MKDSAVYVKPSVKPFHTCNHCDPQLHRGTRKHNKIVKRIKEAAKHWKVIAENQFIGNTRLKPDLVLSRGDEVVILDVTCPFDNGYGVFAGARKDKIKKYSPLRDYFKTSFTNIHIDAIIVGSLGSWDPKNDKTLLKFCSKKYLKLMKKLVMSETIRASRNIFIHHTSKYPQIDYRSREYRKRNIRIPRDPSPLPPIENIPSTSSQNAIYSFINDGRDAGIPSTSVSPAVANLSTGSDRPVLENTESIDIFTTTQVENLIIMTDVNQQPDSPSILSGNSASYSQELFENMALPTSESPNISDDASFRNSQNTFDGSAPGGNQELCVSGAQILAPPTRELYSSQAPASIIPTGKNLH